MFQHCENIENKYSNVLTSMQSRVLLNVRQLFESSVTVRAFVGFFTGVYPDMLHELVIRAERF